MTSVASSNWQNQFIAAVNAQKRTQVSPFSSLVSSYSTARTRLDEALAENANLKKQLATVQQENESVKAELQGVQLAVKGISIKTGRENELESENKSLNEQIRSALRQMQEYLELKDSHRRLSNDFENLQKANEKLEVDLERMTKAFKERDTAANLLKQEVAAYQDENATQRETYRAAKEENQRLLPMIMDLKKKEAELMDKVFELESKIAEYNRLAEEGGVGSPGGKSSHEDPNRERVFLDEGVTMNSFSTVAKPSYKAWETTDCHDGDIYALTITENGRFLWTGSTDRTIRCWDSHNGTQQNTVRLPGSILSLDSCSDILAVGCADAVCRIFSLESNRVRHQLTGHTEKISASYLSRDGQRCYTASTDRSFKSWDLGRGGLIATSLCHSAVNDLAVSNDRICSAHFDTTLRFWDARTGKDAGNIPKAHTKAVTSVRFTSDGNRVVSLSRENIVKVFDTRTNAEVMSLQSDKLSISSNMTRLTVSPDDRFVSVGTSSSGSLLVWDLKSSAPSSQSATELKSGHAGSVPAVCWSPDGKGVASAGSDKKIIFWR